MTGSVRAVSESECPPRCQTGRRRGHVLPHAFHDELSLTRGLARHGIGGLILVLLVITHHLLNAAWYRTLSRGRWRGRRFLVNATGCLLVAVFLAFTASALAMAGDTYPFFPFRMPFWGRGLHTAMTAWLFVLASFHLGLHGASVWNRAERFAGRVRSALFLIFLAAGAFCFVQSGLWNDMLFLGGPKYFPGGMPEFLVWHLGTAFFFCLLARLFVTRAGREGRR